MHVEKEDVHICSSSFCLDGSYCYCLIETINLKNYERRIIKTRVIDFSLGNWKHYCILYNCTNTIFLYSKNIEEAFTKEKTNNILFFTAICF